MRKFLLKIIYFLTPVVLVFLCIHLFYFSTYLNSNITYEFKKELLVANRTNKKIVIIGGSNARYSYSSEVISSFFPDHKVVNCAISAPLGLKFYLNFINPYLNKNDIVILSPEFLFFFTENGVFGDESLIALANSQESFYQLMFSSLNSSKHFLSLSFKHLIKMLELIKVKQSFSMKERKASLAEFHDETGQVVYYPKTDVYSNYIIALDGYISQPAVKTFNSYVPSYVERGIYFYVNFPPVEKSKFNQVIEDQIFIDDIKRKIPSVNFLNTPSGAVYEKLLFYDSPYHLNQTGKLIHTRKMCQHLKERFNQDD